MSVPKWTEERTANLQAFVGDESPVSQETVAEAAERLETSTRSIASKLRKMGFEVELASARATRAFSDEEEATLANFLADNEGSFTYAEIAETFAGGKFTAKQVQGKVLSMQLTHAVKAAPKPESVKAYTDEEEDRIVSLAQSGASLEAIAEAMDRPLNSIRGKALSLLRANRIERIPQQENTKGATKVDPLAELGDAIADMEVEAIAEAINKTPRGVRVMLTRRGLTCADYDGAARAAKNAEAA
jgi:hypothetical protein